VSDSTRAADSAAQDQNNANEQNAQPASNGKEAASASNLGPSTEQVIADLQAQVKEKENKYIYLYAEFENFKKRTQRERSDLMKFGWEPVARDLLQSVDNLERAVEHMPPNTDKNLAEGVKMVLNEFKSTLQRNGVLPVSAMNQSFDPNVHEAIGQEPAEAPAGTVIKEHTQGYCLHGRLLRPARVVVSAGKVS